jgi:hypothetical protein
MKKYRFSFKGMWGICHGCLQPLTDSDYIYGDGKRCYSCDNKKAIQVLKNIIKKCEV